MFSFDFIFFLYHAFILTTIFQYVFTSVYAQNGLRFFLKENSSINVYLYVANKICTEIYTPYRDCRKIGGFFFVRTETKRNIQR